MGDADRGVGWRSVLGDGRKLDVDRLGVVLFSNVASVGSARRGGKGYNIKYTACGGGTLPFQRRRTVGGGRKQGRGEVQGTKGRPREEGSGPGEDNDSSRRGRGRGVSGSADGAF